MRLGIILDRSHRTNVFLVKAANDQASKWAEEYRHLKVQHQPTTGSGPILLPLEVVVDMPIDRCSQLTDLDGVVEVN